MKSITVIAACLVGAATLTLAAAAKAPAITQRSITGARLGLAASDYKGLLGKPVRKKTLAQPQGWSKLVFAKHKVSVYFAHATDKGTIVTTWNKAYKTAAGIGPCSTIKRLKSAYGRQLKPSKFSTQNGVVYSYTVGKNLIFSSNSHTTVDVIGLYDGRDPNVNKPGGSLSYAGFITLNETACS